MWWGHCRHQPPTISTNGVDRTLCAGTRRVHQKYVVKFCCLVWKSIGLLVVAVLCVTGLKSCIKNILQRRTSINRPTNYVLFVNQRRYNYCIRASPYILNINTLVHLTIKPPQHSQCFEALNSLKPQGTRLCRSCSLKWFFCFVRMYWMALNLQEGLRAQLGVHCEPKWDTLNLSIFIMWRLVMKIAGSRITEVRNFSNNHPLSLLSESRF